MAYNKTLYKTLLLDNFRGTKELHLVCVSSVTTCKRKTV
jgi:hypothetical protein